MKQFYGSAISLATAVTAAMLLTALAEAAPKKHRHSVYAARSNATSLSLDGRNTGRSRTWGYATFQYDNRGIPYGPY